MPKSPWSQAFEQGYVCAVANIIRSHGDDVTAKDVLACNKPDDWRHIDAADHDLLHERGLAPARRKSRHETDRSIT